MLVSLFGKEHKLIPLTFLFGFFHFYAKIATIRKVKRCKNDQGGGMKGKDIFLALLLMLYSLPVA